jgi:hypothetical protein
MSPAYLQLSVAVGRAVQPVKHVQHCVVHEGDHLLRVAAQLLVEVARACDNCVLSAKEQRS